MTIFNERFLPIMKKHIEQIREGGEKKFMTVDLIRRYIGHYVSDKTNPSESINANIGKFLGENADALGIREIEAKHPVKDDENNPSCSSNWEFV